MIAPFWDDLNTNGGTGEVATYFDADQHRFIVEWTHMRNYAGGIQTVEAILYDPAFYPTMTGDGVIEFQYAAVSNNDSGDNFATVGIENDAHTDGLLYTFYSRYTGGSAPLAIGRAIRFTTMQPGAAGVAPGLPGPRAVLSLAQNAPNPSGEATAIRFSLERAERARLVVYDAQGRVVRRLLDGMEPAGPHAVLWDGRDERSDRAPAGVYFYRLEASGRTIMRKLVRIE